jgi:hypothetical protein
VARESIDLRLDKRHSRITSQGCRESIDIRIVPGVFFDDDRLSFEPSFQVGGDLIVQAYKAYHRLQLATQAASERLRSPTTR